MTYVPGYCPTNLPALFCGAVLFIINAADLHSYPTRFGGRSGLWGICFVLLGVSFDMPTGRIRLWRRQISCRARCMASLGIITTFGFTCRGYGMLPHRDFLRPLRETGTKKPAAIWAISGGCGFCYWPGKYDTGRLVTDFNLRLQIIL